MEKMQLGVIFGSRSNEHDVSIISAVQLMKYINRDKYDVIPVYITSQGIWYTGEKLFDIRSYGNFNAEKLGLQKVYLDMTPSSGALMSMVQTGKGLFKKEERKVIARLQCIIPVLHGLHGEDGSLQGLLELCNIPYTSTGVCGSSVGMDKEIMKVFFRGMGFPVLPDIPITHSQWNMQAETIKKRIQEELQYPVVVKPARSGSSIGVVMVETEEDLEEALGIAFSFDRKVLIEKGLIEPKEVNCSVLGYDCEATPSVLEMPNKGIHEILDFSAKYESNASKTGMESLSRIIPAPISEELTSEIQQLSVKVFNALDCKGVVRIDYMLDEKTNEYYITEINTIPGSMAFYLWKATDLSYSDLIDKMIEYAFKAQEDKEDCYFNFQSGIIHSAIQGNGNEKSKFGSKFES